LQQAQVHGREVSVGSFTMRLDGCTREALRESYLRLRRTGKEQHIPDHEFMQAMEQLAGRLEKESGHALADMQNNDDWSAIMTWEQVRQIAGENVTVGSHTVDHIRLALVKPEVARDQVLRSKQDIEARTGKPCLSLCYPNGSFNKETVTIAKECGYSCGVTTEEGLNRIGDDAMTLKRMGLGADLSRTDLLASASGVSLMLNRIYRRYVFRLFSGPAYAYRLVRSHGIRRTIVCIATEVYSNTDYVVTQHSLDSRADADSGRMHYRIEQLRENDMEGIEDVCNAWPANWRSKHLKTKVIDDLKKGDVCLLLRSETEDSVLGAVWLCKSGTILDHCPIRHGPEEGVVRSLFVTPGARGQGLSKVLLSHVVRMARERGISRVFGYALPYRTASIRAQLSTGFHVVGTMKVSNRMGRTRYTFVPAADMNDQPMDTARADPVIRL